MVPLKSDMGELAILADFLFNRIVKYHCKPLVLRTHHRSRYAGLFVECEHREAKADPLAIFDRSPGDDKDTSRAHVSDQIPIRP